MVGREDTGGTKLRGTTDTLGREDVGRDKIDRAEKRGAYAPSEDPFVQAAAPREAKKLRPVDEFAAAARMMEQEYIQGVKPEFEQARLDAQQRTLSNVGLSGMISAGQAAGVAQQQARFAADEARLYLDAKNYAKGQVRMDQQLQLQRDQFQFAQTQWEAQNARAQEAHLLNMQMARDQMETTPFELLGSIAGMGLGAAATGFGGAGGQMLAYNLFAPQGGPSYGGGGGGYGAPSYGGGGGGYSLNPDYLDWSRYADGY